MSIQFRIALQEDKDKILNFLRESYYLEEPLTIGSEPPQQTFEDEEFSISNIQYGTSVLAIEISSDNNDCNSISNENDDDDNHNKKEKEKIIGIALTSPKYPNEADHIMEMVKKSTTPKWIELLKLFAILEHKANVFQRYNVTKALHLHVLSVCKKSRGKSIGIKLMEKCMEIGKELGYQLLTTDCTSVYSIRLAEKLNMDCVGILPYKDYYNENNEQIFKPPQPHNYIKTFAKLL